MNKKVYGVYLELLGSRVCELLINNDNMKENDSITLFLSSKLYELLSDESIGLINYSPYKLYDMLKEEIGEWLYGSIKV